MSRTVSFLVAILAFLAAVNSGGTSARAQELVTQFCYEEGEGAVVADSIGENNGQWSIIDEALDPPYAPDPVADNNWVPGRSESGGAIAGRFRDGSFVLVNNEAGEIDWLSDYSFTTWIKSETPEDPQFAFPYSISRGGLGLRLQLESNGQILFEIRGGDLFEFNVPELVDGEWHHLAVTVETVADGSSSRFVAIYVDGELGGSAEVDIDPEGEITDLSQRDLRLGVDDLHEAFSEGWAMDNTQFFQEALDEEGVIESMEDEGDGCMLGEEPDCTSVPELECPGLAFEGPPDGTEGPWLLTVTGNEELESSITYDIRGVHEDGGDDFELSQSGSSEFAVDLRAGEWIFTIERLSANLFCPDQDLSACQTEFALIVDPRPEEQAFAFCFEDSGEASTTDSLRGLVAELFEGFEGAEAGDGVGPRRVEPGADGDGQALEFDGVADIMEVEENLLVDPIRDYTLSMWMQVGENPEPDFNNDGEWDLDAGALAVFGSERWEECAVMTLFVYRGAVNFSVGCSEPGTMRGFSDGERLVDIDGVVAEDNASVVTDGEWHHVALVADMEAEDEFGDPLFCEPVDGRQECTDVVNLYIDGRFAGRLPWTIQIFGPPTNNVLKIGRGSEDWPQEIFPAENGGTTNYFNGRIDNVQFFSAVLALGDDVVPEDFQDLDVPVAVNPGAQDLPTVSDLLNGADLDCEPGGEGVGPFVRGDVNNDGGVPGSTVDMIFYANWVFVGSGPQPECMSAADANGDGFVGGSTTDIIYLANFLFLGSGPPPPSPFPDCAVSNSMEDVDLGCVTPPDC